MPSTRTFLLCTTMAATVLTGFVLYAAQPAPQQAVPQHPQSAAQLWAAKRMAELEPKTQIRTPKYGACAARLRADYDGDPARAYGWVRTLCRP